MHELTGDGKMSRRDFLKLGSSGLFGLFILPTERLLKEKIYNPTTVSGVEVCGLGAPIHNKHEMAIMVEEIDEKFIRENDPFKVITTLYNFDEARDRLLPQNERFLTVFVKESVYKEYLSRHGENSPDYATWITLHTDLTNRIFENSMVKTEMRMRLRRIVVVDDNFDGDLMNKYPMDTDFVWIENEDYREKKTRDSLPDYMWNFAEQPDGSIFFDGASFFLGNYSDPVLMKTNKKDIFNTLKNGKVDCGLTHEWRHLGFNDIDTYTFDVSLKAGLKKAFRFNTWYNHKPVADPYTAMVINENIEVVKNEVGVGSRSRDIRGYYSDPFGLGRANSEKRMYFFGFVPESVEFKIEKMQGFELGESRCESVEKNIFDYYRDKHFVLGFEDPMVRDRIVFDNATEQFGPREMGLGENNYPLTYVLRTWCQGNEVAVFFPRALLNMAYMGGLKEKAIFDIKIGVTSAKGRTFGDVQVLDFVSKNGFSQFAADKVLKQEPVIAYMELPGTDLVCVWSYVDV